MEIKRLFSDYDTDLIQNSPQRVFGVLSFFQGATGQRWFIFQIALFLNRCLLLWFTMTTTHIIDYAQYLFVKILLFKQLHCSPEEGHQLVSLSSCSHTSHNTLPEVTGEKKLLKYALKN